MEKKYVNGESDDGKEMRNGSIAFLSTTLPTHISPANLTIFRSTAVVRSASVAPPPLVHRLSSLRYFPVPITDSKIHSISGRQNLFNTTTTRTISRASASSMASSFSPEKARVPPAIESPVPPITKFKIGLCQLSVTADKDRNIRHARLAIEDAAEKGAKLVLLPEIWNSPYANESFPVYAEDIDAGKDSSPSTAMLSEAARSLKITIVGGSIPERCGEKLYNTCCVFDTDGNLKAKHRKIHLFDINIPGKITFEESKTLTAGETPTIVDTDVGRIGIGICYDIQFQELAMIYAARGAHLLCYPGAFNMTTGPLHWELLQRARAVDNQLYVATCSPARDAGSGYVAWGHSTLVGPFGEVLATTEHEEATIISEIDYSLLDLRRTNLPLQKQRRGDLYSLVDVQRLNSK